MSVVRDIVDEQDMVVGRATKEEISEHRYICRVAFVMLANSKGELLLHQRAATKRAYPLYWSGAAAGHLLAGESYEKGASRELMEEIGVAVPLELVGKFYSEADREMVAVFLGFYDGPIKVEAHEVEQVGYFSPASLERQRDKMQITSFVERALPLVMPRLSPVAG
jgi:isopentenyldiphosphate isomerase